MSRDVTKPPATSMLNVHPLPEHELLHEVKFGAVQLFPESAVICWATALSASCSLMALTTAKRESRAKNLAGRHGAVALLTMI